VVPDASNHARKALTGHVASPAPVGETADRCEMPYRYAERQLDFWGCHILCQPAGFGEARLLPHGAPTQVLGPRATPEEGNPQLSTEQPAGLDPNKIVETCDVVLVALLYWQTTDALTPATVVATGVVLAIRAAASRRRYG
jgi:hypothetical protein